ncbi:Zn-dependent protease with chaperone function [Pseudomonas aeruginosa PA38182]|nr:Zn-dependent protease with chaperone function [Pseudomonas aeruginosa PA38182]
MFSAAHLRMCEPTGVEPVKAILAMRLLVARASPASLPKPWTSGVVNAFATGSKHHAAIALTDGLLRSLTPRELTGVLGHEIAHIANEDLRVMGLADSISRLTHLLALLGQLAIVLSLPALLLGVTEVNWPALLLLAVAHSWPCWLSWACPGCANSTLTGSLPN